MAQKGGKLKTFFLVLILIALLAIAFIVLGGGKYLSTAGKHLEGVGKQAEELKQGMKEKAATVEKRAEDAGKALSGEKK